MSEQIATRCSWLLLSSAVLAATRSRDLPLHPQPLKPMRSSLLTILAALPPLALQALADANECHLTAMTELQERLQKDKDDSLQSLKTSVTAEKQVPRTRSLLLADRSPNHLPLTVTACVLTCF